MRLIDADKLMENKFKNDISYNAFCNLVKRQPSIDAVKHGRWELIDDTEFRIPGYRCSVCHCECEDWEKKPTYKYCPNCGASMEGEENG